MEVKKLNRRQLDELKYKLFYHFCDGQDEEYGLTEGQIKECIDATTPYDITDETVFDAFAGIDFVPDDFGFGNDNIDEIYTHDEAMLIVEAFEDLLEENDITIPSPEDDEKDPDNEARIYGSTYSDLLDDVETMIKGILSRHKPDTKVIEDVFSGRV